jgi:hypothetical protein
MNGRRQMFSRAARVMISDGAIVWGLALAPLGDAYVWRESGDWSWPLVCLSLQVAAAAAIVIAGEYWISKNEERSCVDAECKCGTTGTKRISTWAA